jgi:predicted enzyme related to lactoylglutathione lyase
VGGVALYADRADLLAHWYEKHLGLFFTREPGSHDWWCDVPGGVSFAINQAKHTVGNERRHCEITWKVADLDQFVEHLGELGATIAERQETANGDFAWLVDPEGNRIELCQDRHL